MLYDIQSLYLLQDSMHNFTFIDGIVGKGRITKCTIYKDYKYNKYIRLYQLIDLNVE